MLFALQEHRMYFSSTFFSRPLPSYSPQPVHLAKLLILQFLILMGDFLREYPSCSLDYFFICMFLWYPLFSFIVINTVVILLLVMELMAP